MHGVMAILDAFLYFWFKKIKWLYGCDDSCGRGVMPLSLLGFILGGESDFMPASARPRGGTHAQKSQHHVPTTPNRRSQENQHHAASKSGQPLRMSIERLV
jgi:hypothetical protein